MKYGELEKALTTLIQFDLRTYWSRPDTWLWFFAPIAFGVSLVFERICLSIIIFCVLILASYVVGSSRRKTLSYRAVLIEHGQHQVVKKMYLLMTSTKLHRTVSDRNLVKLNECARAFNGLCIGTSVFDIDLMREFQSLPILYRGRLLHQATMTFRWAIKITLNASKDNPSSESEVFAELCRICPILVDQRTAATDTIAEIRGD